MALLFSCCSNGILKMLVKLELSYQAKSNDQPNRVEINQKVVEVLQPEVEKLYTFMRFTVLFSIYLSIYITDECDIQVC